MALMGEMIGMIAMAKASAAHYSQQHLVPEEGRTAVVVDAYSITCHENSVGAHSRSSTYIHLSHEVNVCHSPSGDCTSMGWQVVQILWYHRCPQGTECEKLCPSLQ